jgi:hypothetical protein
MLYAARAEGPLCVLFRLKPIGCVSDQPEAFTITPKQPDLRKPHLLKLILYCRKVVERGAPQPRAGHLHESAPGASQGCRQMAPLAAWSSSSVEIVLMARAKLPSAFFRSSASRRATMYVQ